MSADTIQFVDILVKPTRADVPEFLIRINALDFKTLQDRMLRPITILDGVKFNKTIIDRFIDVFIHQIRLNPVYSSTAVCIFKVKLLVLNKGKIKFSEFQEIHEMHSTVFSN